MAKYVCPNVLRRNDMNFLMCKKLIRQNERYETIEQCASAICAHAYYCPVTRRWENTDGAKKGCRIKMTENE